jgi:hypothetical protein
MRKAAETWLHRIVRPGLSLLLISIAGVAPVSRTAYGYDHTEHYSYLIRRDRVASPAMVGTIDSPSLIMINGRETQGSKVIWSGDLLELPTDTSARLILDFMGVLALAGGAIVRLSTSSASLQDGEGRVLIASLMDGDMVVDLRHGGDVYIEAGQSIITASGKVSFRIRVRNGIEKVDALKGEVAIQARPKRALTSTITKPGAPSRAQHSMKSGKEETLVAKAVAKIEKPRTNEQVLYTSSNHLRRGQVDTIEQPDANRLLRFEVDPFTFGTVTPQSGTTDQNGEVRFIFKAGSAFTGSAATCKIIAKILNVNPDEETIVEERPLDINIAKPGFWDRHKIKIFIVAAAVAAVIPVVKRPANPPLMKTGPPR